MVRITAFDDNDVYTMYCGNESGETNVFSKDNQEKEIAELERKLKKKQTK